MLERGCDLVFLVVGRHKPFPAVGLLRRESRGGQQHCHKNGDSSHARKSNINRCAISLLRGSNQAADRRSIEQLRTGLSEPVQLLVTSTSTTCRRHASCRTGR